MSDTWSVYRHVTVWSQKKKAHVAVRVDITFDLDEIAREMGRRALGNKSGKSKLAVGINATAKERAS